MSAHDDGFNQPPTPIVADDDVRLYPDVAVAAVRGYRPIRIDVRVPAGAGPFPVLIYVHGGAWRFGDRVSLPPTLAPFELQRRYLRRGYAVADLEYRLTAEAEFPAQLHDVKAGIRWLRRFADDVELNADRFALLGESAGGHLVAMAGLTADSPDVALEGNSGVTGVSSSVRAVVDWYGVADIESLAISRNLLHDEDAAESRLLGGTVAERPESAAAASPVNHVHPDAPPFLCVHGTADEVVPYAQSELLCDALRKHDVRCDLVPVPDADHCFIGHDDVGSLIEASIDFTDEVLGIKPA